MSGVVTKATSPSGSIVLKPPQGRTIAVSKSSTEKKFKKATQASVDLEQTTRFEPADGMSVIQREEINVTNAQLQQGVIARKARDIVADMVGSSALGSTQARAVGGADDVGLRNRL